MGCKLLIEAPVNGGRNYNGPKVNDPLALVKPNQMRETPLQPIGTRLVHRQAVKIQRTWGQSAGKTCLPQVPSETRCSGVSNEAGRAMDHRLRGRGRLLSRGDQSPS